MIDTMFIYRLNNLAIWQLNTRLFGQTDSFYPIHSHTNLNKNFGVFYVKYR